MTDKFSPTKIQSDLYKLTGKQYSISYINNTIKKIFDSIVNSQKKKFLISGSQGCGKSTLLELINKNFKNFYNINPLCINLDNYYLAKKQRSLISKKIHPLLVTRGVPGTHNIKKLIHTINLFEKQKYPIIMPKFDKLKDDINSSSKSITKKKDIVFLEGWCCGCDVIDKLYLYKNLNKIERMDHKLVWRKHYNKQLKNNYKKLFNKFEYLIFFKIPKFNLVLNWKIKQEMRLILLNKKNERKINKQEMKDFISHYEKITKWMIKKTPSKANIIINISEKQKIETLKIINKY